MRSLFILSLYAAVGSCSSPDLGALPVDSWFSDLQGLVLDMPVMFEARLLQVYALLRQHPQFAVPAFYLLAGYFLYRLSKLFTKEPSYNFKIIQEASSEGLLAAVKAELESFKQEIRKVASERPAIKASITPDAVKQLSKEIQQLYKVQSEFQIEMLESHKDLWQTLGSLKIQSGRSEDPALSNGSALKVPTESSAVVLTYEANEELDEYGIEQSSHNASFGSSLTPSLTFSLREEVEKEDVLLKDASRKNSMSAKLADTFETVKLEEPKIHVSEHIKLEEPFKKPVDPTKDETTKAQATEALKKDELPKTRPSPVEPIKAKATLQRRRDQQMPEVVKSEVRAKYVSPPQVARNPFGL